MKTRFAFLTPLLFLACGGRSETSLDSEDGPELAGDGDAEGDGDAAGDGDGDTGGNSAAGGRTNVEPPPAGGATSTGGAASSGGAAATGGALGMGGTALSPAEIYCEDACESVPEVAGSCTDLFICPEDGECLERADRWTAEAREAFEWCLENDPMCFVSAEGCILTRLLGDAPYELVISASSLDFVDGTIVGLETQEALEWTQIEDGAFHQAIDGRGWGDYADPALIWIDENGDEVCNAGDWSRYVTPVFNGDFTTPLFVYELTADDPPSGALTCPEAM